MTSAWQSGRGYLAKYKPLFGKICQRRVPKEVWNKAADPLQAALDWAATCEQICAEIVKDPAAVDVQKALKLGAINEAQATALLNDLPPPPSSGAAVTIEAAFFSHPSSQRETGRERERYIEYVGRYTKWSGSNKLHDLTLDSFTRYRDSLIKQGYSWDYRRHLLLPLRRVSKMAAARFGMPDVLGSLRLDKPERRSVVEAWTLEELGPGLVAEDLRLRVSIGLGAFVGLRLSEVIRIRCDDLRKDGRLPIGLLPGREGEAKNASSRRLLPMPRTLAGWMRELAEGRKPDATLLETNPGNIRLDGKANSRRQPFTQTTYTQWLGPLLAELTGKDLPAKSLRKTFATWTRRAGLHQEHREIYLGHETELAQSITGQRYISDLYELLADEMKPTTAWIEQQLHKSTQRHKSKRAKARSAS